MGLGHSHHSHSHAHSGADSEPSDPHVHRTALVRALSVTLVFAAVEIVGGYASNSLALISDSVHMLTDAGALALSLAVIWMSKRKAPRGYTFGYQRLEILGALLNGLLVWLLTGFLIFESIERFQNPPDVKGVWVFWIALIGLGANLSSLYFLHRSSKENLNIRSAYLHVLTDSLGSVGALIAGAVIALTGYRIIDPMITVALSLLMLWSSWSLVREAVGILMERSPSHLRLDAIEAVLRSLNGVCEVHDLHVWTLSSGKISLSVHLIAEGESIGTGEILHEANHRLEEEFGILHTTIQVEPAGSDTAEHCSPC
jgi:cobalt-zinc-cadmium efflux system protein